MPFISWINPDHPPLVIAHRGGALLAAENTAGAFQAAMAGGADAVETDVRRTTDGVYVCLHDADLLRLYGDPRAVAELDLATLRSLVPAVMTLKQAIDASRPLGLLLDVKLMDRANLPQIINEVAASGAMAQIMLGLRDIALITAVRTIAADIAILALVADPDSHATARNAGATWFRLWQGMATPERAAAVHGEGMRLAIMVGQPRSVPLPEEHPHFPVGHIDLDGLKRLALLAPDAILLDDPRLLTQAHPTVRSLANVTATSSA